uniref:FAD-binding oxidoreductase n=1 Tax=Schlesneria paludicola TaxID=360056 RepID=A0A7C2JZW0_9PLAN
MPPTEFTPATQTELARFVAENAAGAKQRLCPAGGRTALRFGFAGRCDVLVDTRELKRVVDYPARDMTITVEAGLPVAELQQLLATENQQLPIDVPQAGRATIGGAIACNVSGPRRFGYGTFRDYVIGISAVDAQGRLFQGGGRVVKNVAGYDVCKLLVGSRGTLAAITQVTLKLKPRPQTSGWWWLTFDTFPEMENVLQRLLTSAARPTALEMLDVPAAKLVVTESRLPLPAALPVLAIQVDGTDQEVAWQLDELRKEVVPFGVQQLERLAGEEAEKLTTALTEFPIPTDEPLTFQANVRPSRCWEFAELATKCDVAVQCHAGNGVIIGQFPEQVATLEQARGLLDQLRHLARRDRGNLIVLHCDPEWQAALPMCGDPEPAWPLMVQLKRQLDPDGLWNPDRFIDRTAVAYTASIT